MTVSPPDPAGIELRDVHKSFGDVQVLRGVSLRFPMGETTAIIGPSGAGKSVLLKQIVGLVRPDAGQAFTFGVDMASATPRQLSGVRRRVGMLFQDGALFDSMSVGENIEFPLVHNHRNMGTGERRDRVEQVLEQVGLAGFSSRTPSKLSGGQRKRVGLARAIVGRPEVVLFDEPNSGLDPLSADAIDALIVQMKEALGITFILISHDIVGTLNVADHIGMLYEGSLIAFGGPRELIESPHPVVRRFLRRNVALPGQADNVLRLPAARR